MIKKTYIPPNTFKRESPLVLEELFLKNTSKTTPNITNKDLKELMNKPEFMLDGKARELKRKIFTFVSYLIKVEYEACRATSGKEPPKEIAFNEM